MSFGWSAGDVIAGVNLLIHAINSLKDVDGSRTHFQELESELQGLSRALREIVDLGDSGSDQIPEIRALKFVAYSCEGSLARFYEKIKPFAGSLGVNSAKGKLRAAPRMVRWELLMKKEIPELRTYLVAHVGYLNMRLGTATIKSVIQNSRMLEKSTDQVMQQLNHQRLTFNAKISQIPTEDTIPKLDELVLSAGKVWKAQEDMMEMLTKALEQLQPPDIRHTWAQAPVTLEDALGRQLPVPSEYNWEMLHAVIQARFKNGPGYAKVRSGEYELFLSVDASKPATASTFQGLIPGTKVSMCMIVGQYFGSERCPRIGCTSRAFEKLHEGGSRCTQCKTWFRRSSKPLPKPLKPPSMSYVMAEARVSSPSPSTNSQKEALDLQAEISDRRCYKNVSLYVTELPPTPTRFRDKYHRHYNHAVPPFNVIRRPNFEPRRVSPSGTRSVVARAFEYSTPARRSAASVSATPMHYSHHEDSHETEIATRLPFTKSKSKSKSGSVATHSRRNRPSSSEAHGHSSMKGLPLPPLASNSRSTEGPNLSELSETPVTEIPRPHLEITLPPIAQVISDTPPAPEGPVSLKTPDLDIPKIQVQPHGRKVTWKAVPVESVNPIPLAQSIETPSGEPKTQSLKVPEAPKRPRVDLWDLIRPFLERKELLALIHVCKYPRSRLESYLYEDIRWIDDNRDGSLQQDVRIEFLLRTLLHRPQLAAHIKHIRLVTYLKVGHLLPLTTPTAPQLPVIFGEAEEKLVELVVKKARLFPEPELTEGLKSRSADAMAALLLSLTPNLQTLSITLGRNTPLVGSFLELNAFRLYGHRFLSNLRKIEVSFDLAEKELIHSDIVMQNFRRQIISLFVLPSVNSVTLSGFGSSGILRDTWPDRIGSSPGILHSIWPYESAWPDNIDPARHRILRLKNGLIDEIDLGQLLAAFAPSVEILECEFCDLPVRDTFNCSALAAALEKVHRSLQSLTIRLNVASSRALLGMHWIEGSIGNLTKFAKLRYLEIPLVLLLGENPAVAPILWDILPKQLHTLCCRDDTGASSSYEWSREHIIWALIHSSKRLKRFILKLQEVDWDESSKLKLRNKCDKLGIRCQISYRPKFQKEC